MNNRTLLPFLKTFEKELIKEFNFTSETILKGPLVSVGGFSGVGKDTLALGLKKRFLEDYKVDVPIFGAGDFVRDYARKSGYSDQKLDEFLHSMKNDEEFARKVDFYVDKQTLRDGLTFQKGIFIGRMAPFALGTWAARIWLFVNPEIRAARLVQDPNRQEFGLSESEILKRMERRDINDKIRLERIYNIKIDKLIQSVEIPIDNSYNTIIQTINNAYNDYTQLSYQLAVKIN